MLQGRLLTWRNSISRFGDRIATVSLHVAGGHPYEILVAFGQALDFVLQVSHVFHQLLPRQWDEVVEAAPLDCNEQAQKPFTFILNKKPVIYITAP